MIHDGALHYWNISRILNKPNQAHKLVTSATKIVQALGDIDDQDVPLRIQLLVQLALCQDSSDADVDGANKTMSQTGDLLKKIENNDIVDQVSRIQLYIARRCVGFYYLLQLYRSQKKNIDSKSPNAKFISMLQPLKSNLQSVNEKDKIVKEIQDLFAQLCATDVPKSSSSKKKDVPVVTQKKSKTSLDETKCLLVAELGLVCVAQYPTLQENVLLEIATQAQELVLHAQALQTRILAEFIKSQLCIHSLGCKASEKLTQTMLNGRLKGIRILEKALESCVRLDSQLAGDLIHIGCVFMWNSCLCMLQSNLRSHIRKSLTIASSLLSDIESHQFNYLRTLIHLELANNDISDDVLTKATSNIKKALHLDYVADKDEQNLYALIRPVDRILIPMEEKLELKTNVYKIPEGFVQNFAHILFVEKKTRRTY